jgi:hypothetical protein
MLKNNKKRASLTIEIALGLVAAVVVLILIIGTFNDKMNPMVKKSNFQRLFNTSSNYDPKTNYTGWDKDPTTNLVATAASNGEMTLADWQAQALKNINALLADGMITDTEKFDLAKYLTEYLVTASPWGSYGDARAANGQTLSSLQEANGIKIDRTYNKTTKVEVDGVTKTLNWSGTSLDSTENQCRLAQQISTATWN